MFNLVEFVLIFMIVVFSIGFYLQIKTVVYFNKKMRQIDTIIMNTPQFIQLLIDSGEYED